MMDESEYLKTRVNDQIDWYSKKAKSNKDCHLWTKGLTILFSAIISLISGFDFAAKNIILGLLGALIAVISGLSSLLKFQEKWSEYRTTSETLIQEKMLYGTLTGPYNNLPEPFKELVTRVENIINKEHSTWTEYIKKEN